MFKVHSSGKVPEKKSFLKPKIVGKPSKRGQKRSSGDIKRGRSVDPQKIRRVSNFKEKLDQKKGRKTKISPVGK